jgi:MFS family permease
MVAGLPGRTGQNEQGQPPYDGAFVCELYLTDMNGKWDTRDHHGALTCAGGKPLPKTNLIAMPQQQTSDAGGRRNMNASIAEGFFTQVGSQFAAAFLTPYALGFGATKTHIALLSIIPNALSNWMQVLTYSLTERMPDRRKTVLFSMAATRLAWIPVALVPLFASGLRAVYALLFLQFCIAVSQSLTVPAWTSIMGDIVPREMRGRFFATRNIIMNVGTVFAAALAGRMIAAGGFPRGFQFGIVVYFMLGMAGVYAFSRVNVPLTRNVAAARSRVPVLSTALNLRTDFGRYVSVITFHNLAVAIVSSFFNVFMLQELGGTATHLGYMTSASTIMAILAQRLWGPVIDSRGEKLVMGISGFTIAAIPALWLLTRNPWHAVMINAFAGLAWSGWNLGAFNMLLLLSPESRKQGYIAVGNSMPALAGIAGTMIGGVIADSAGIRPLMAASAVGRFLGAFLFLALVARRRDEASPPDRLTARRLPSETS